MAPEHLGKLLQSAHSAYETADDANAWHRLRRFELIGFLIGGTLGAWLAYEWLGDIEEIGKLGALIGASLSWECDQMASEIAWQIATLAVSHRYSLRGCFKSSFLS